MVAVLAIDIGASGGKAFVGKLADERLELVEVHRFANGPVERDGRLTWDTEALLSEVRASARAAAALGHSPRSLAIDTWAVDFALVDGAGRLTRPVYAYRDARWPAAMSALHRRLTFDAIYATAGIQQLPFNSIYQLAAADDDPGERDAQARAARMVMVPEYLTGLVCGRFVAEVTNASTTSLLDARTRAWSEPLAGAVAARRLLPEIVEPGTCLAGGVDLEGLRVDVRVPACHDTACAVAAAPLTGDDAAYISSGTWSLVGVELDAPVLGAAAGEANWTNEAGVAGRTRFLKNVMGLWLLQACRREWGDPSFEHIERAAAAYDRPVPIFFPDDPRLLAPASMVAALGAIIRQSGQAPPEGIAATARCIKVCLALRYRQVVEELESLTGRRIRTINVVGGGARDDLLCRLTASATGRTVVAGPVEATALGNTCVQLMGMGALAGLDEARSLVARSVATRTIEPDPSGGDWDALYGQYLAIANQRKERFA